MTTSRSRFQSGELVAVMGGAELQEVRRICRVVVDLGPLVIVESDSKLEGDAAVEYDFPTPPPAVLEVPPAWLRRIK